MKVPKSVRDLYASLEPRYRQLSAAVDDVLRSRKEARWHYESRIKGLESFALKLETGRVPDPKALEDFFGCTIVVERPDRIQQAEELVRSCFDVHTRRPQDPSRTHLEPHSFEFDDLRLYAKWKDDPRARPTGFHGLSFEVQVKTFLQHAWSIATHDFLYKSDSVDWSSSRIAFQVKAMLENAELAIGASKELGATFALSRSDKKFSDLRQTISEIEQRWSPEQLPRDRRTLAQNVLSLARVLRVEAKDLWSDVDEATEAGEGAYTLNLSPFCAIVAALVRKRGEGLFQPLGDVRCRDHVFVPGEVDLPRLSSAVQGRLVRTAV